MPPFLPPEAAISLPPEAAISLRRKAAQYLCREKHGNISFAAGKHISFLPSLIDPFALLPFPCSEQRK
jgi:hypothetical protein